MKYLALARHAHAESSAGVLDDFDRPLSARGRQEADRVGLALARRGHRPQLIVASPALRTRETANRMASILSFPIEDIRYEETAYDASTSDLLELLQALPDRHDGVLVVGHNPAIERAASLITSGQTGCFSPGKVAWIAIDTETWHKLMSVPASLEDLIIP